MRQPLFVMMLVISVLCSSATSSDNNTNSIPDIENNNNDDMSSNKITIKVNSKTFTATLLGNNLAKAFKEILPITIRMTELNENEKKYDLHKHLPANPSNPETINSGDLMLYGSKTLVLFYKTFATTYSYTKLGTVDDVSGLATAVGKGNVTITFAIK